MKRLITLSLCLSLCLLLFSGCGSPSVSVETPSQSTPAVTSPEEPSALPPSPEPSIEEIEIIEEGIGLDGILEFFASETAEGYQPREGFDKENDETTYGELTEVEYYSNTTGASRKCFVFTPPGYDPNETYPVLYLLHGIGGTHTEWLGGSPKEVLSNLIALGEAAPMIAVIPNIRAMQNDNTPEDIFSAESIAAFDNFINDLRDDLMPFIKENYSVSDKREDTAIAGLSMGGRESLFIGVSMPETFGYIGAFEPAPGLLASEGFAGQVTPEEMTLPEKYFNDTFIMINAGNQDSVVGDNPFLYNGALEENGLSTAFYAIDGGHSFGVWKNGLYWFAKCIFQNRITVGVTE